MSTEFWSLDGGVLRIDGPGVASWPAAISTIALRGWMGRASLHATAAADQRLNLERNEGMQTAEKYQHASGPMELMTGPRYGVNDFAYYGEQHALLWEAGGVGLTLTADGHSKKWFLDYAQQIRFETNAQSVRAKPAKASDWTFERLPFYGSRLTVNIPDIGLATVLSAAQAKRSLKSDRSKRLKAGTLHTFDGQRRQRIVLQASTASVEVSLLEASLETAAERLSELRSIDWRS